MNFPVNTQMNASLRHGIRQCIVAAMDIADELDIAMRNFRPGGISQPELAKLSGVPQPTISRTLKGKSTPETSTLVKLARALNCTLGGYAGTSQAGAGYEKTTKVRELKAREPAALPAPIDEIVRLAISMTTEGRFVLLGRAQELAGKYATAKANHSS